jgi:hypothetical protein
MHAQAPQTAKTWQKPNLQRLGRLRDVAGPSGVGLQAAGGGQNRS